MTQSQVTIRRATIEDSRAVATLVHALLLELEPDYARTLALEDLVDITASLLTDGQGVWAFLADAGGGEKLIDNAVAFGRERGWSLLDVGPRLELDL